ncbi:polysaccharide biosynthesis protein [Litoribrevibacter albus]|uniref:UDP-N-acetylglucosamine 4,6-dehydratase n=1 Tax=Litoribrevibacter albus TaxID=1473156 RepID=A0AA37SDK8_9GAMM|nr:polysaccharide biosynthesis protein [Litoribrevibacter albus]GLQ33211.1 UDP-N-acetylglucosamine 4,6-dehydratase [Litoribrevibacter albus]
MKKFENKTILVTGSCGTVGKQIISQLLNINGPYKPKEVVGIDNNESELFFQDQKYLADPRSHFYVADIKDENELIKKFSGVDIVFHTAAMKHVVLSERSPDQVIQNNIVGVQNVINAAIRNEVERVIFTSSDKAVNPTNVMGTSKLMGERLVTAANSTQRKSKTIFTSTRFGNVLGSRGSVVPIFKKQIQEGKDITLTHKDMTRFVMTVEEAVSLVLESAEIAKGGEVFVTKMPVLSILDLAKAMIEILSPTLEGKNRTNIKIIGLKPGEKLYEELMSSEETRRTVELDKYFSVLPAFKGIYNDIEYMYENFISGQIERPYISEEEPRMSVEEIKEYLVSRKILEENLEIPDQRYWPGDKESNRG